MKINTTFYATLAALFAISLPAMANGTGSEQWDWETELQDRTWSTNTLQWASSIHPDNPSTLVLLASTAPPPREIYCGHSTSPVQDDCDIFNDLLEDWMHDYLGLSANESVNSDDIQSFPEECITICAQ